jgi:hypothetical protein
MDMKAGSTVGRRERLVGVLSQTQFRRLPKSLIGSWVLIGNDPSWYFPFGPA